LSITVDFLLELNAEVTYLLQNTLNYTLLVQSADTLLILHPWRAVMTDLRHDLKVIDFTVIDNGHNMTELSGIVENASDILFHYVEVQFNAYDDEGYQVDSVVTSVNNLEPGGKWKFLTPVSMRATDVKLIRIIADDGEKESSFIYR
jgi:hypothetical protein